MNAVSDGKFRRMSNDMEPFPVPANCYDTAGGGQLLRRSLFEREQTMSKDNKERPGEMNVASEAKAAAGRPRKLDKSVQTAIGARLRAYYDGVERETIPDRFVELLKQLDKKEPGGDQGA